jgi:hypothetical protein
MAHDKFGTGSAHAKTGERVGARNRALVVGRILTSATSEVGNSFEAHQRG